MRDSIKTGSSARRQPFGTWRGRGARRFNSTALASCRCWFRLEPVNETQDLSEQFSEDDDLRPPSAAMPRPCPMTLERVFMRLVRRAAYARLPFAIPMSPPGYKPQWISGRSTAARPLKADLPITLCLIV